LSLGPRSSISSAMHRMWTWIFTVGLSPASIVAETSGSVGASGAALGAEVLVAVVVGIAFASVLWWAYLDLVMLSAERRFSEAIGGERARDSRAR
jgi:hypothetical protein